MSPKKLVGTSIRPQDVVRRKNRVWARLGEHLQSTERLAKGIVAKDLAPDDVKNRDKLEVIFSLLAELNELSSEESLASNIAALVKKSKTLVGSLGLLSSRLRTKTSTILARTEAVLAHANARSLDDALAIAADPEKASTWRLSKTKEFKRIAVEFRKRFPYFLGYRIKVQAAQNGFRIFFENPHPKTAKGLASPFNSMESEVMEYLNWELKKNGDNFEYETISLDEGRDKAIVVEIEGTLFR